ncbi:dienelactone hydrolase [Aliishimia ponticola]|uniref:Dienelactone hydrolase n=1 Tax=Aliishimia ponticola TaxID=2499833 RepID=A0A4S4NGQ3_9RHOB|nr:dienelactone hydrolase [Aliishimia ponticola]THH37348.1 dienelactone hydrolase [Aliishimia ponticola]
MKTTTALTFGFAAALTAAAQAENRIDTIRPDAPELAAHGDYPVGVRTLELSDPGRIDVLNVTDDAIPTYDRPLTVELWYPAAAGTTPGTTYDTVIRDGQTATQLQGMATRDAAPASGETFPVIVISHGYPGNRYLMSHLGENLASKGYVTVSIDHTDSTYSDQTVFGSTLLNRPHDQRFVLDQMGDPEVIGADLAAITDATTAGLIGYSMGGYGALIYGGAGVTKASTEYTWGTPRGLLEANMAGTESHAKLTDDPRLKAVIAIGPWGRNTGFWDAEGMKGFSRPLMLIAGSVDDVSIYNAMRMIFDETSGTTRHLLTFNHANHNAAAPMPAPAESYQPVETLEFVPFEHYADAVWDTVRMNNITQHFATAFMDLHVKGDADKATYFDLVPNSDDSAVSVNEDGTPKPDNSQWQGFPPRTAKGLRFETKQAGE